MIRKVTPFRRMITRVCRPSVHLPQPLLNTKCFSLVSLIFIVIIFLITIIYLFPFQAVPVLHLLKKMSYLFTIEPGSR